jgi:hypothetical protein
MLWIRQLTSTYKVASSIILTERGVYCMCVQSLQKTCFVTFMTDDFSIQILKNCFFLKITLFKIEFYTGKKTRCLTYTMEIFIFQLTLQISNAKPPAVTKSPNHPPWENQTFATVEDLTI